MTNITRHSLRGIYLDTVSYADLLDAIKSRLANSGKLKVTYLNAACFNILYDNAGLAKLAGEFDIIHPDGVGIYLAAKFLNLKPALEQRFTGSDFYPQLWKYCISHRKSIFFFGHDEDTLSGISRFIPDLAIAGVQNGYNYDSECVIKKINGSGADILVIGLSYPAQEKWLSENFQKLNCRVAICTGEGIKVFAGSKKRGPRFMQAMGLEWMVRLVLNPFKYFKRYVIGIPLFLYRIIIIKIRNLA